MTRNAERFEGPIRTRQNVRFEMRHRKLPAAGTRSNRFAVVFPRLAKLHWAVLLSTYRTSGSSPTIIDATSVLFKLTLACRQVNPQIISHKHRKSSSTVFLAGEESHALEVSYTVFAIKFHRAIRSIEQNDLSGGEIHKPRVRVGHRLPAWVPLDPRYSYSQLPDGRLSSNLLITGMMRPFKLTRRRRGGRSAHPCLRALAFRWGK